MIHRVIYKDKKAYCSFPLLDYKSDDEIYVGFFKAPVVDHHGIYDWIVMKSTDKGETWEDDDSLSSYLSIGGVSPRERSDRCQIDSGEKLISIGSFGFEKVGDKIGLSKHISIVSMKKPTICGQTIENQWSVRTTEIYPAGFNYVITFNRPLLSNGYAIAPGYGRCKLTGIDNSFIIKVDIENGFWEFIKMFPSHISSNEVAIVEVSPTLLLAMIRDDYHKNMYQSWSNDTGKNWSYPIISEITGGPVHLLKLHNGGILCTYGIRDGKMGIMATVLDHYMHWDKPYILRDDSGWPSSLHKKGWFGRELVKTGESDVGYPVSIQLQDGSILTVYYITLEDMVTHISSTKWKL